MRCIDPCIPTSVRMHEARSLKECGNDATDDRRRRKTREEENRIVPSDEGDFESGNQGSSSVRARIWIWMPTASIQDLELPVIENRPTSIQDVVHVANNLNIQTTNSTDNPLHNVRRSPGPVLWELHEHYTKYSTVTRRAFMRAS